MNWKVFFTDLLQSIGVKLIFAALLFAVGMWAAKLLPKILMKTRGYKRLDETLANFIMSFIKIALYAAVFVSVAIVLGVPATSFITALASAAMGLFVSSLFTNADRAMTVAPILLMPQILFSGLIFKVGS